MIKPSRLKRERFSILKAFWSIFPLSQHQMRFQYQMLKCLKLLFFSIHFLYHMLVNVEAASTSNCPTLALKCSGLIKPPLNAKLFYFFATILSNTLPKQNIKATSLYVFGKWLGLFLF